MAETTNRRRRRWPFIAAALVVVLVAGAAVGWFVWLPRYRPNLHASERYGIDVSAHQRKISWTAVANDHIGFAYIKATEGGDFTDPMFTANWTAARAAGVARGAYHFFTFCTPGMEQARHFLAVIGDQSSALPPAVDLELKGNCHQRPDRTTLNRELTDFLTTVDAATGRPTVLYVGDDFEQHYLVRARLHHPLWQLRWFRRPSDDWTIWQAQNRAHIDGIHGDVDLDVGRHGT